MNIQIYQNRLTVDNEYVIVVSGGDSVYDVIFYEDNRGQSPVLEYIRMLQTKSATSKDARIKLNKITDYIYLLRQHGTRVGEPVMKHIVGTELWELRPLADRIFFAYWSNDTFILLHHFVKKSQKTPPLEIGRAISNLQDFLERNDTHE